MGRKRREVPLFIFTQIHVKEMLRMFLREAAGVFDTRRVIKLVPVSCTLTNIAVNLWLQL